MKEQSHQAWVRVKKQDGISKWIDHKQWQQHTFPHHKNCGCYQYGTKGHIDEWERVRNSSRSFIYFFIPLLQKHSSEKCIANECVVDSRRNVIAIEWKRFKLVSSVSLYWRAHFLAHTKCQCNRVLCDVACFCCVSLSLCIWMCADLCRATGNLQAYHQTPALVSRCSVYCKRARRMSMWSMWKYTAIHIFISHRTGDKEFSNSQTLDEKKRLMKLARTQPKLNRLNFGVYSANERGRKRESSSKKDGKMLSLYILSIVYLRKLAVCIQYTGIVIALSAATIVRSCVHSLVYIDWHKYMCAFLVYFAFYVSFPFAKFSFCFCLLFNCFRYATKAFVFGCHLFHSLSHFWLVARRGFDTKNQFMSIVTFNINVDIVFLLTGQHRKREKEDKE